MIISKKSGKLHLHASIGALVQYLNGGFQRFVEQAEGFYSGTAHFLLETKDLIPVSTKICQTYLSQSKDMRNDMILKYFLPTKEQIFFPRQTVAINTSIGINTVIRI